jgi:AraC family transcriptional regulator of adaptative response / DNA-3-methyladenine glycosylase II
MPADSALDATVCARALESRDPRFDGVFFVGIRTTMIYCRPICPARISRPERRRYFDSAAAAERHGYRPCMRCRPELAPGRAIVDAVPQVAHAAARRIAAGALNGGTVGALAGELGVSERHLRRAMERELGVSPGELAQTQRLLLAKCLLTDTTLPVTQIAFASGFQSLRRFHSVFREHYRMPPTALRRRRWQAEVSDSEPVDGTVRLRLPYRPPLAWDALAGMLAGDARPGVEVVERSRYGRTVALAGVRGAVFVQHDPEPRVGRARGQARSAWLTVDVSVTLLPALMPLMARLRHAFDMDAEPGVIDAHLARSGLRALVARCPGLRVAGAFDGFEAAMRELLDRHAPVVDALGDSIETGHPGLTRLWPTPEQVVRSGPRGLAAHGVPERVGEALVGVAWAVARGGLRLEPGADFATAVRALAAIPGIGESTAAAIATRALHWPDSFPATDASLARSAEAWRPWRSYAAAHLALHGANLASA